MGSLAKKLGDNTFPLWHQRYWKAQLKYQLPSPVSFHSLTLPPQYDWKVRKLGNFIQFMRKCYSSPMFSSESDVGDGYSDFDTLSKLEKTLCVLGSDYEQKRYSCFTVVTEFIVDVWELKKLRQGCTFWPLCCLTLWGGIRVRIVSLAMV